ncbi:MAG: phosphoribosylformylglycinamidine synthase PurS protein [Candidatus Nanohalarchaeota archaeon]|nr:MAG: phosphoribosylformylglycinamidine synthase PurS protein [Candidatus Nanohaloarchaeota archaeon]
MKYCALVTIGLKKGILDPEGLNTKKALELLGFSSVVDVAISKVFEITVDAPSKEVARAEIDKMCMRLLYNPVVNEYTVTFR